MKIWGQISFTLLTISLTIYHRVSSSDEIFTIDVALYIVLAWYMGRQYDRAKHFERLAKISENSYKNLLDRLPSTIIIHKNHQIKYVNEQALSVFRSPNKEVLVGMSTYELVTPKYTNQLKMRTNLVEKGSKPLKNTEYKLKRLDGSIMDFEVASLKIIFNGEEAILSIGKDITEKKEQTDLLLQKSEKLALLGQMAAGIAHEIRNPLTSIKGFVQLFKGNQEQDAYYDIVLSELDRINAIVGEFLFLAKPTASVFKDSNVMKLLNDVVTLIHTQTIMNNIQIVIEHDKELPSIHCEESQLKQVFLNILKNAVEAMPKGGFIHLKVKKKGQSGIRIQIIDQGVGIPKERIPTLGEPFYTTKEKGTGLGLMTCYKIIENHKGELRIDSELNKGTIVEIVIPAIIQAPLQNEAGYHTV